MSTEGKPAGAGASGAAVLFLSDAKDADLRRFIDVLIEQGIRVDRVRDVYTAAAMLATGCRAAKLLVDIRTLDDKEMLFLRLARRFLPATGVLVPRLPGADQRESAAAAYGVRTVGPDELAELFATLVAQVPPSNECKHEPPPPRSETRGASEAASTKATPTKTVTECPAISGGPAHAEEATSEADPAEEQIPEEDSAAISEYEPATEPLAPDAAAWQAEAAPQPSPPAVAPAAGHQPPASSVEADSTSGLSGPSLHEAVRQRMAADGPTAARRPPPRRPPAEDAGRHAATDGGLEARPSSDAGDVPTRSQPSAESAAGRGATGGPGPTTGQSFEADIPPVGSRPPVEPTTEPASQARRAGTLGRAMLSPEEMDALLREELPSDAVGASPPPEQAAESGPDVGEVP